MDKKIPKKKFYVKYKYPIAGGIVFIGLLAYIIATSSGASKLRIEKESLRIEEVKDDKFMEYVDVEGLIQPILTLKINTRESGNVEKIVAEEGTMLSKGDTILILENMDLVREIEDKQDEWQKTLTAHKEKVIEMEQKSLDLKQQTLKAIYELDRLKTSYELDMEEFRMGVKSKAQLDIARSEFEYKTENTALQLESLLW